MPQTVQRPGPAQRLLLMPGPTQGPSLASSPVQRTYTEASPKSCSWMGICRCSELYLFPASLCFHSYLSPEPASVLPLPAVASWIWCSIFCIPVVKTSLMCFLFTLYRSVHELRFLGKRVDLSDLKMSVMGKTDKTSINITISRSSSISIINCKEQMLLSFFITKPPLNTFGKTSSFISSQYVDRKWKISLA